MDECSVLQFFVSCRHYMCLMLNLAFFFLRTTTSVLSDNKIEIKEHFSLISLMLVDAGAAIDQSSLYNIPSISLAAFEKRFRFVFVRISNDS